MRYKALALVILFILPVVACGWKQQCVKPTAYILGEETTAVMGTVMIQQTVYCLLYRYEPQGLNLTLWNKSPYEYA